MLDMHYSVKLMKAVLTYKKTLPIPDPNFNPKTNFHQLQLYPTQIPTLILSKSLLRPTLSSAMGQNGTLYSTGQPSLHRQTNDDICPDGAKCKVCKLLVSLAGYVTGWSGSDWIGSFFDFILSKQCSFCFRFPV